MQPFPSALLARLHSHPGLKVVLFFTLPAITTAAYLAMQRAIIFPARTVPLVWLDRAVPFEPRWVWAYLSLYPLNPVGPLLTRTREDLLRYTRGMLLFFASGLVWFVLFPVAGPRPAASAGCWLYDRLLMDRPYNSFPSLHAACAAYAVFYAAYASAETSRPGLRKVLLAFAWVWVGLILYSTIATRQHFAIDLPLGIFLAWLAQLPFLKRTRREVTTDRVVLNQGEAA